MHLFHHGIKGQRWGVRNGPPYPIEDKVLRKGTRLNSVSTYSTPDAYKSNGHWMYTYNPDDKWDRAIYTGPFLKYKALYYGWKYANEHEFEVVKDLKLPTKKERVDEFIDLYAKKKDVTVADLEKVREMVINYNVKTDHDIRNLDVQNLKTRDDYEAAYELFNHAMENVAAFKSTKSYADLMEQKYDAMVDDNNQGTYNGAHDPIIIFRANEALKSLGSRKVPVSELLENYKYVAEELEKEGKRVKL